MDENIYTTNVEMKPQKPFFQRIQIFTGTGDFSDRLCEYTRRFICCDGDRRTGMEGNGNVSIRNTGSLVRLHFMLLRVYDQDQDRTYFSKLLVRCVRIIGGMITASSFILPRLSGYRDSGFEIMHSGSVTLIDGSILMIGVLLLIFAGIIKEGFSMQKELDEVL